MFKNFKKLLNCQREIPKSEVIPIMSSEEEKTQEICEELVKLMYRILESNFLTDEMNREYLALWTPITPDSKFSNSEEYYIFYHYRKNLGYDRYSKGVKVSTDNKWKTVKGNCLDYLRDYLGEDNITPIESLKDVDKYLMTWELLR